MIFTYLKIQDLLEMAGKEQIKDLASLAHQLELRYPIIYEYKKLFVFMSTEDDGRSRKVKASLFSHILEVLQIDPHDVLNRFIEQPKIF